MVKSLELLDNRIIKVLEEIATIRNNYAHGVKGFSMTLKEYFLNDKNRHDFVKKIATLFKDNGKEIQSNLDKILIDNPKLFMTFVILYILAEILFKIEPSHKQEVEQKSQEFVEAIKKSPEVAFLILILLIIAMIGAKVSKEPLITLPNNT